jgi:hypothetical protein
LKLRPLKDRARGPEKPASQGRCSPCESPSHRLSYHRSARSSDSGRIDDCCDGPSTRLATIVIAEWTTLENDDELDKELVGRILAELRRAVDMVRANAAESGNGHKNRSSAQIVRNRPQTTVNRAGARRAGSAPDSAQPCRLVGRMDRTHNPLAMQKVVGSNPSSALKKAPLRRGFAASAPESPRRSAARSSFGSVLGG